ncbi:MAG TPA: ankyrin repeat domain-containing protein [Chryseosolibacter sp.]
MTTDPQTFCQACMDGNAALVAQLLETDPSLVNCRGAVRADHRAFMKKDGADEGWTPLHLAAHYGQPEIVKLLLAKGAGLDAFASNAIGNTPVMAAIAGRNLEVIRLLVSAGANLLLKDKNGYNALDAAGASKDERIIALVK